MLTTITAFTLLISPPPLTAEQRTEQIKYDKEVLHHLSLAFDDDSKQLAQACPQEDRPVAGIAVRAAVMTEERARRSGRLADTEPPRFRAENQLNSATLSIDATDYWLKAFECWSSQTLYLDHAELALVEAERFISGNSTVIQAIAARRSTIRRYRQKSTKPAVETVEPPKPVQLAKPTEPTEPIQCPHEDQSRSHRAALLAATIEERAIQLKTTQPGPATETQAASLFVEAAQLWFQAWKCQRSSTVYLDYAEQSIVNAEKLGATTTVPRYFQFTIQSSRRKVFSERFSLRLDFGYGSGRLAPTLKSHAYTHRGGYVSISAMARLPPKTGVVSLLLGPYYTYWGAKTMHNDDPKIKDAGVHEVGAKLEVSIGFKPRVAKIFTLHPGLEFGMQYVAFETWTSPEAAFPDLVEQAYVSKAGPTIGGSVGACFVYSSFCAMARVHSVPDGKDSGRPPPTVMVGVGIDFFRVTRALLEWLDV